VVRVNGTKFPIRRLDAGETRLLDVSAAVEEGDNNTFILTAKGWPGSSAVVTIRD